MTKSVVAVLFFLFSWDSLYAATGSYFTVTGDRVMINIQSGRPFSSQVDEDAKKLYEAMNVKTEDSIMGKGKKVAMKDAMTLIVAERGKEQFDGTIMVYQWPGVQIDNARKTVNIQWTGEEAELLHSKFKSADGKFEYSSEDGRLKIYSDHNQFLLSYSEWN